MFDETLFPPESLTLLDTDHLPLVTELWVHSRASTDLDAFSSPQLIIKHSWNSHRFHARLCVSRNEAGILCNQSYLSVHADLSVLEAACVSHNSKVAVYFHFLTSGRFAAYRPKLSKDEILGLPIPHPKSGLLGDIESYPTLDERAFELFGLKDAERVLVEDAVEYTLDDFLHGTDQKVDNRPALTTLAEMTPIYVPTALTSSASSGPVSETGSLPPQRSSVARRETYHIVWWPSRSAARQRAKSR